MTTMSDRTTMVQHRQVLYDSCTIEDLRAFIKARAVNEPKEDVKFWVTKVSKFLCVSKLQELDHMATFRFMDLPAELREEVYRCMLLQQPRRIEVLATGKVVNLEASYIVHKERVLPIQIIAKSSRCRGVTAMNLDIGRARILTKGDIQDDYALRYYSKLPNWIRNAQKVNISIMLYHPEDDPEANEFPYLANLFYALISKLATGNLKALHIELDHLVGSRMNDEDDREPENVFPADVATTLLRPLTLLPNNVSLSIYGVWTGAGLPIFPNNTANINIRIGLFDFLKLKDEIRRTNALVISTNVAPEGIRFLSTIVHEIENRQAAHASTMPDFEYFEETMGKIRETMRTPKVRKLIESAKALEAYWGEGCCCA